MLQNLKDIRVVLGSGSARRQQLLAGLGLVFETIVKNVEETVPDKMPAWQTAMHLASLKMSAYTDLCRAGALVITSDTVVISDGSVIGKPKDRDDALRILQHLSGKSHEVITAVRYRYGNKGPFDGAFEDSSRVHFNLLEKEEIEYYVDNFEVMDKAGSYGIQDWLGMVGIRRIEGSFYNVMGLPVDKLYAVLKTIKKEV